MKTPASAIMLLLWMWKGVAADLPAEVGVIILPHYMVRFELDEGSVSSSPEEQNFTIGFSTWDKRGILMRITNDDPDKPEYISVEMNNNGGVKVVLDVGFEREELNTHIQVADFADGEQHVAVVTRTDYGRTLTIKVDDYPATVKKWDWLSDIADTMLDNPKYIYFGRNEATVPGAGFNGCLYNAQFGTIYPLKGLFDDPRPASILLEPTGGFPVVMCGATGATVVDTGYELSSSYKVLVGGVIAIILLNTVFIFVGCSRTQ